MPPSEPLLKRFGSDLQRVINRQSLSRERSYEMFREILLNQQTDLQQGAFLAALAAKGETAGDIAGAWQAIDEIDTVHVHIPGDEPLLENSGTGMDRLKTFNVSSAAGIVAAACGVRIARHGARALTSFCGSVDILESVGICMECDPEIVARSIQRTGIGIFNGMSPRTHPQALGRILSQIRFGSTLNIAASLAHPCRPTHAVRGIHSCAQIPVVREVMTAIGYRRGMVVHGFDAEQNLGMDEISVLGETAISDFFPDGKEVTHRLTPEAVGLKRWKHPDIAPTGDLRRETDRFAAVIAGRGCAACTDFTALNAGAILYVAGKADSIGKGVRMAQEALASGKALQKLGDWVNAQSDGTGDGRRRFEAVLQSNGIAL
jgi:anthranilate phosphoribosyltransferase